MKEIKIGDRVRIISGNFIGEMGVVTGHKKHPLDLNYVWVMLDNKPKPMQLLGTWEIEVIQIDHIYQSDKIIYYPWMFEMQSLIANELGVRNELNPKSEVIRKIVFLEEQLKSSGANGYVLGISGGQDSTLAGKLAQLSADFHRTRQRNIRFIALRLPYGDQHDEEDVEEAICFINPDEVININIKDRVDSTVKQIAVATGKEVSDHVKANIKARERMLLQYAIAGMNNLLVIGTNNASELATGFFTKYGDGASDVSPIADLTKAQVKALLKSLGCPERLLNKVPIAGLLDENPNLTDEEELGLSYEEIDAFLTGAPVNGKVFYRMIQKYYSTQHKRSLPITH